MAVEKKDCSIKIRVSESELKRLDFISDKLKISRSEVIRDLLFKQIKSYDEFLKNAD